MFGRRKAPIVTIAPETPITLKESQFYKLGVLLDDRKRINNQLKSLIDSLHIKKPFEVKLSVGIYNQSDNMVVNASQQTDFIQEKMRNDVITTYQALLENVDRELREYGITVIPE